MGGGSKKEVEAIGRYGRSLGLLLVIRAEFVDIYEADELTNRIKNECFPLPVLYAIQNNTQRAKIQKILESETISQTDCENIVDIVHNSNEIINLKNHMLALKKEAIQSLAPLKDGQAKSNLELIASSMLEDL